MPKVVGIRPRSGFDILWRKWADFSPLISLCDPFSSRIKAKVFAKFCPIFVPRFTSPLILILTSNSVKLCLVLIKTNNCKISSIIYSPHDPVRFPLRLPNLSTKFDPVNISFRLNFKPPCLRVKLMNPTIPQIHQNELSIHTAVNEIGEVNVTIKVYP